MLQEALANACYAGRWKDWWQINIALNLIPWKCEVQMAMKIATNRP